MTWNGLIQNAGPDTIAKAFIANAVAAALVIAFTIHFQTYIPEEQAKLDKGTQLLIVMSIAMFSSLLTYTLLYLLLGYGSGMTGNVA